jgi:hypothetical protein
LQVERLLQRYQELTTLQAQINIQLTDLAMEQQVLLKEPQKWLRTILSITLQARMTSLEIEDESELA